MTVPAYLLTLSHQLSAGLFRSSSSNVDEVIRAILNLFIFFTRKFYTHKKHKMLSSEQKQKRQHFHTHKIHLRRRKSIVRLFAFLCFLCFLCVWNLFVKKKKKVWNCPNDLIYITTTMSCMKLLEIVLQWIRCFQHFRIKKNLSSSSLLKRAVQQLTVKVMHELSNAIAKYSF